MALSSYCHGYLRKKLRIKSLNCGPHKKPIYFAAPFRSCSKRNLVKENGLRVSINFRYWHIFGEPRLTIFFFFFSSFHRVFLFLGIECVLLLFEARLFFFLSRCRWRCWANFFSIWVEATRDFIGFEIFFEMLSIFHLASFFLDGCRKLERERENWSFYQKNNYSVIEEIEIIRGEFINWEERD